MQVVFDCPRCLKADHLEVGESTSAAACRHCGWTRTLGADDLRGDVPQRCAICGCADLWRQKDFPPQLGVVIVGLGIVLSTVAVAWMRPVTALAILMVFALADMLLFLVMRNALVCYRCHARYRYVRDAGAHPKFDLEVHERYRQEAARLKSQTPSAAPPPS